MAVERQALGLIETVGFAAAVEGADAAVKAANVRLLGYELTRGGGMVMVKLSGDVAAVQAAVTAGAVAASRVGKVVSKLVIPRPHGDLDKLIRTPETVGAGKKPVQAQKEAMQAPAEPEPSAATAPQPGPQGALPQEEYPEPVLPLAAGENKGPVPEVCNLCGDPACPRRKGEPRSRCIHFQE